MYQITLKVYFKSNGVVLCTKPVALWGATAYCCWYCANQYLTYTILS